ncbi:MAG: 16S rRNA (uracil(1498)-N(3))-methyltransferase, partial [Erysipelotrichaceae bacterium]|nr:16S rRNA (uracil(1498)-N(3))-methyltransferase [Erysipelotrichaceae bacterium]
MRQYFVEEKLQCGSTVVLNEEVSHHLKNVLRCRSGDKIRLVDGDRHLFLARLQLGEKVEAEITEELQGESKGGKITCCPCLIKREKWELLIQKAAELGADRIVPVISRRTIVHPDAREIEKKLARWNKIALEACQQSNRTSVCTVEAPIELTDIGHYLSDNNLLAYENEEGTHLIDLCDDRDLTSVSGPEGGFEPQEVETLRSMGFIS